MTERAPCVVRTSLVIPVYNAAGFIEGNLDQAVRFMADLDGPNEIIVVDDASSDGTDGILADFAGRVEGVSFIFLRNEKNFGKGYSVRRGMRVSQGRNLIFNDADFTYPVEEVGAFTRYLEEGLDVAIGCRIHPDSTYIINPGFIPYLYTRHVMSRIFNLIVNLALGLRIRDTQAGIKGFKRAAAEAIFERQSLNRFSFDLEMLFIARRLGFKVQEVPVHFIYRKEPTTIKFFRDSMHILYDITRIRLRSLRGIYR